MKCLIGSMLVINEIRIIDKEQDLGRYNTINCASLLTRYVVNVPPISSSSARVIRSVIRFLLVVRKNLFSPY